MKLNMKDSFQYFHQHQCILFLFTFRMKRGTATCKRMGGPRRPELSVTFDQSGGPSGSTVHIIKFKQILEANIKKNKSGKALQIANNPEHTLELTMVILPWAAESPDLSSLKESVDRPQSSSGCKTDQAPHRTFAHTTQIFVYSFSQKDGQKSL